MTDKISLYMHPTVEELDAGEMVLDLLTPLPAGARLQVDLSTLKKAFEKASAAERREKYRQDNPPSADYIASGGWRK